ncbi:MAG TPA: Uma2 family endonuclease [Tepidisphaeraceae bacterium]|jgi:Uma2 family endonuclease
MSVVPIQHRHYSVEEYLQLESQSPEKHEFWDGFIVNLSQLIGMAGGTYEHSLITVSFARALGNQLQGGSCRVMSPDMRIKLPRSPLYFYPDASVICGQPQFDPESDSRTTLLNPRVIIEVISPSTEVYDRGKKLVKYIEIPTLEEYVLISQAEPRIDTYFRHTDGSWTFSVWSGLEAVLNLRALEIKIPLAEVYAGIEFPPDSESAPH